MSQVLLMGFSNAGKTVYGAQLYGRILHGASALRSNTPPERITPLREALEALEEGRSPKHTPLGTYESIVFSVLDREGGAHELVWPDYDGEQCQAMLTSRVVPPHWVNQLMHAEAWLIMLRPSHLRQPPSAVSEPATRTSQPASETKETLLDKTVFLPSQVQWVELLQLLWWARSGFAPWQTTRPRLTVLLSCFDEVADEGPPMTVLAHRCPLLLEYINHTWHPDSVRVFGLSAQGGPLTDTPLAAAYRETFQERGPMRSGHIVDGDGHENLDLTLPVAWLFKP